MIEFRPDSIIPYKIKSAEGAKITASKLQVGKTYLQTNLYNFRTIVGIVGDKVFYQCKFKCIFDSSCSKSLFARTCPNEITEEEMKVLQDDMKNRYPINY